MALKVVGENQNPTLPGGWIYELIEPLPMRITYGEKLREPLK